MNNFVKRSLLAGGSIRPLIVPHDMGTNGTGLFNPSVYLDGDKLLVNVRHCQYTILHSEKQRFEHQWGPLVYLCPEDDLTLTTTNYLCELDRETLILNKIEKVDTSDLDVKPIWEFVGLEDARVVRWDDKLYLCGVRRDTTTNGQGRMEMSEVKHVDGVLKEISRFRIPAPGADDTYCEKNWMPIVDMPYHFIKWSNPTEIVKVSPEKNTCETVYRGTPKQKPWDYRGGSHVIPWGDKGHHIAISHVLTMFKPSEQGRKNAQYRHCFIEWDAEWNVVNYGNPFDFMDAEIEFCCGMTEDNGRYLITFGFQDNVAYIVETTKEVIEEYM